MCKLAYQQQEENGKVQNVKEQYLIDAMSFTEAEARVYEELGSALPAFMLTSVAKMNVQEIFPYDDTEIWYKAKVQFLDTDERTGKEKKTTYVMLVNAATVRDAYDRISERLGGLMATYQITDVNLTWIVEVFPYVDEAGTPTFSQEVDAETGAEVAARG